MAKLADITAHLDTFLDTKGFDDYCPNGLQVEGRPTIDRVVTGVSASVELFRRALDVEADAIIVHHGIFWRGASPIVAGPMRERLALLLGAEVSLLAYHLPLDGHPQIGNNALIAAELGATAHVPFALHNGRAIGVQADIGNVDTDVLIARVQALTGQMPLAFSDGPPTTSSLAIVSGAGSDYLDEAKAAGADTLLTGEPTERAMNTARELGLNYIAAGHYATETFGVRALGEHLAASHGVEHIFVDVPNPI